MTARSPVLRACSSCGFGEGTFAGVSGNDEDAPIRKQGRPMRPDKTLFALIMLGALAGCYPPTQSNYVQPSQSSHSPSIPPMGMGGRLQASRLRL